MTAFVKVHRKGQMTLPSAMRVAIGIAEGDLIEVRVSHGKIVLTPKSPAPDADSDHIRARLAEGLADTKAGRIHSFSSVDDMREFVEASVARKSKPKRKAR